MERQTERERERERGRASEEMEIALVQRSTDCKAISRMNDVDKDIASTIESAHLFFS
jgi:hypothetical protein